LVRWRGCNVDDWSCYHGLATGSGLLLIPHSARG
jgi:hypothetical protein